MQSLKKVLKFFSISILLFKTSAVFGEVARSDMYKSMFTTFSQDLDKVEMSEVSTKSDTSFDF